MKLLNRLNSLVNDATTTEAGYMSASDKIKLNGIQAGATATSVTQTLSSGTEIGSITVNGTTTTLYAPQGGGGNIPALTEQEIETIFEMTIPDLDGGSY